MSSVRQGTSKSCRRHLFLGEEWMYCCHADIAFDVAQLTTVKRVLQSCEFTVPTKCLPVEQQPVVQQKQHVLCGIAQPTE